MTGCDRISPRFDETVNPVEETKINLATAIDSIGHHLQKLSESITQARYNTPMTIGHRVGDNIGALPAATPMAYRLRLPEPVRQPATITEGPPMRIDVRLGNRPVSQSLHVHDQITALARALADDQRGRL